MRTFFKTKKGVTIIEGLMALLLLAIITVGTFGVILSTSRKTAKPDIQEEMMLAVEKANDLLQIYSFYALGNANMGYEDGSFQMGSHNEAVKQAVRTALGINAVGVDPLQIGTHSSTALLPPVCDPANSSFVYNVSPQDVTGEEKVYAYRISYDVTCNGYTL